MFSIISYKNNSVIFSEVDYSFISIRSLEFHSPYANNFFLHCALIIKKIIKKKISVLCGSKNLNICTATKITPNSYI